MDEEEEFEYPSEYFRISQKEFIQRFIKMVREYRAKYDMTNPQETLEQKLFSDRCKHLAQTGIWPPDDWCCPENELLTGESTC